MNYNRGKKSKPLTLAQKVINVFPSFNELMNDDKYGVQHLLHPFQKMAFSNSQQWEGIAMAVNNMCYRMFQRELYTSYAITKKNNGSAYVLPAFGDEIKVTADEFKAILKIMMIFNMGLVTPTKEQVRAYENFYASDSRIYKILN